MAVPQRILPGVKNFFDKDVLPKDKGGYVLAIGAHHKQISQYIFIQRHLEELAKEHNLGLISTELPPYMDVLLWAYRDNKLPMPKDEAADYMRRMFSCYADSPDMMRARADTLMKAMSHDVRVCNADARTADSLSNISKVFRGPIEVLERLFRANPTLREEARTNSFAFARLGQEIIKANLAKGMVDISPSAPNYSAVVQAIAEKAFLILEIKQLLKKQPRYQTWLDNIDAVVIAGKKLGIGEDAVSAAIASASCKPSKNMITDSGLAHLMGRVNENNRVQGTIVEHLVQMKHPTKAIMFLDALEIPIVKSLLEKKEYMEGLVNSGIPKFELPFRITLGDSELHQVFQREYGELQKKYAELVKREGGPKPRVYGTEYIERMQNLLEHPRMRSSLSKLGAPWQR